MTRDPDPCCFACESTAGVCRARRMCAHHKQAEKQMSADDKARETYRNPTADAAIQRADRRPRTRGGRR